MQCAGPSPARHIVGPPRACIVRGRIRGVREVNVVPKGRGGFLDGSSATDRVRALEIDVEPDDGVPCSTPLDATAKETRLDEADYPDLAHEGLVRILGGERIASLLAVGKSLCGWTRYIAQPGLGYPTGWEGELGDGAGRLLAAYSFYFDSLENKHLARSWRFSREGAARRLRIDEGGAFVYHDAVRIHHGGQSVVSKGGAEVVLKARDGALAVQATSDLTEGPVPVFVQKHDGFFFAAVRVER